MERLPLHGGRRLSRRVVRVVAASLLASGGAVIALSMSAFGAASVPPHILLVMMENEGYDQVVGGSATPYITSLADDYGLATQSYALAHPSLPNYLDLYSGSDQGITQDEPPSSSGVFEAPTIATQLAAAGISMKAYSEDLPSTPSSDSGSYVVHHNPWEYFTDPPPLADGSTLVNDLNSADAPDFAWFTPNEIDDGDSGAPQATLLSDGIPSWPPSSRPCRRPRGIRPGGRSWSTGTRVSTATRPG